MSTTPVRSNPVPAKTGSVIDRGDASTSVESVDELLTEAAVAPPVRRKALQDVAVSRSLGLARALANRYRERGEPLDDLMQVAYTGLILAVRRFQPDNGARFSTFATPTILGELRRYFRDQTWAIRPPRRLQEDLPRVRQAVSDLEQANGTRPSTREIAKDLGISEDAVREAQQASSHYRLGSLDAAVESGVPHHVAPVDDQGDPSDVETLTTRMAVRSMLETLDEKSQRIVRLRFFDNLTQQQIAERIGVSQMQVSRLLKRILVQLREAADGEQRQ